MPKVNSGGESNGWEWEPEPEPEVPAAAPEPEPDLPPPPPVSAPKAEHVSYVADALGVPAEEAAALKKTELVELARQAEPPAPPEPDPAG